MSIYLAYHILNTPNYKKTTLGRLERIWELDYNLLPTGTRFPPVVHLEHRDDPRQFRRPDVKWEKSSYITLTADGKFVDRRGDTSFHHLSYYGYFLRVPLEDIADLRDFLKRPVEEKLAELRREMDEHSGEEELKNLGKFHSDYLDYPCNIRYSFTEFLEHSISVEKSEGLERLYEQNMLERYAIEMARKSQELSYSGKEVNAEITIKKVEDCGTRYSVSIWLSGKNLDSMRLDASSLSSALFVKDYPPLS